MRHIAIASLTLLCLCGLGCAAEPPAEEPAGTEAPAAAAQEEPQFADDFESGDTESWSETNEEAPTDETAEAQQEGEGQPEETPQGD